MNNTDQIRRRLLLAVGVIGLAVLLVLTTMVVSGKDDPTTIPTIPTAAKCAQGEPVFQRYSLPPNDNRFGEGMNMSDPASDLNGDGVVDVADLQIGLHQARCVNPALMAAHTTAASEAPVVTTAIMALTQSYIADRTAWADTVAVLEIAESKCAASIEDMSGPYQTMDMTDTHPIPEVHQVDPDVPHYAVLRFTCPDGKMWNYKINCLWQPVAQFPTAPPPQPTGPSAPPCTNCTPPPVTTPPVTTPPTTSGCPTGPNGCKKNVPWTPGQCSQPDQNCQPGVGPSVPRPADPVQPTPSVAPPSSMPPPTQAPPPPSQPPQGPVTTIVTAPA